MMTAKKEKSQRAIRKEIVDFLNATSCQIDPKPEKQSCGMLHKNSLVLATSAGNKPRATVLEFFNEGLDLYIWGEPGGKIANIKRNSNVSAVIYEQPLDHSQFQRSLQIFGSAALINVRNNPRLFRAKAKKWKLMDIGKKIMSPMIKEKGLTAVEAEKLITKGMQSLNLIKISPAHIILKEYHPDFSLKKYEWRKSYN
jgi:nitroimidazol reductase NimA-like FMN-containing flavoprotein (pyridoxamine 5'-phosphate oxidase superfamily)